MIQLRNKQQDKTIDNHFLAGNIDDDIVRQQIYLNISSVKQTSLKIY